MEEAASGTPGTCARRAAVRPIAAFQALPCPDGRWGIGLCVLLAPGARIEIRGPGFSAGTALAHSEGAFYFVLWASVAAKQDAA